jgi:integrase
MDIYVGSFLMSLTKKNGDMYEPDTLTSFHRSINRKLEEIDYGYDIVKAPEFKTSRDVLAAKRRELKQRGKGNRPNKAEPLTENEEEQLWTSGTMGLHSPESLFNMVWYLNTKLLGFRGSHESKQLKWGDIQLQTSEHSESEYLEFTERETKTRTGNSAHTRTFTPKIYPSENPDRCPVAAYKKFAASRPTNMKHPESPYYLAINYKPAGDNNLWFKKQAMGVERLQKSMSRMAEAAGLDGHYTNHSVRKTMCTQLLHAGIAPTNIIQLTGHKNVQSLNNYAVASRQQQKEMHDILLHGQKRKSLQNPALPQNVTTLALPSTSSNDVLTPPSSKKPCDVLQALPEPCNVLQALPEPCNTVSDNTITPQVSTSLSKSQHMVAGMFAGAIFNGPVNISISK